jgi:hypothetical protein
VPRQGVGAGTAVHVVVARTTDEGLVAALGTRLVAAEDIVPTLSIGEGVRAAKPVERVVAAVAL